MYASTEMASRNFRKSSSDNSLTNVPVSVWIEKGFIESLVG